MNVCKVVSRIRLPFIYHSIRCLICYVVLISLLRQHCCPAAAILLSFCGNIVVLLRQYEKGMKQYKGDVLFTGQQ